MKIIHLIKKDLLLAGMYFVFAIMILLAVPIFLSNQTVHMSSVYILFISVSFACYFLFNNIFLMEDKYKGNLYLLAVPYKKSMIVAVKYILGLLLTILEMFLYFLLSKITLKNIVFVREDLTLSSLSVTFLAMSVVLSIFFPLYFRFSYTKIKMALLVVMIMLPTWGLVALFSIIGKNLIAEAIVMDTGISVLLIVLGLAVLILSAGLSVKFLEQREF